MHSLLFEISDRLMESIAKSKAVVDLLRVANNHELGNDTLPDIGWLLNDELEQMKEQVNRLPAGPGN